MNACLSGVKPGTDDLLYLDAKKSHEENTEMVIAGGLSLMDDSDFKCWRPKADVKVENGFLSIGPTRQGLKSPMHIFPFTSVLSLVG